MVDSPARLFRRYAQWLPCVSEPRRRYTEGALNAVDFSRPASIQAALRDITQMGRVDRFFDRALHGKSKAASLLAFGILALYKHADAQGEDAVKHLTDFIHENFKLRPQHGSPISREDTQISRERVVMMLRECLTETAKADLLQTTEYGTGLNEFSIFLAAQDRCSMAAQVAFAQGEVYHYRGEAQRAITAYRQAAQAFDAAAKAYEDAGVDQSELAAQAYKQAGDAYLKVAQAYTQEGRHDLAAQILMSAAQAYVTGGHALKAEQAYKQAGDAYLKVAQSHTQEGRHDLAAHACRDAATAYVKGHRRDLAKHAYGQAGVAYAKVAAAAQADAKAYQDVRRRAQAKIACETAAKAFWEAALAFSEDGQYDLAIVNFSQAAELYTTLDQQTPAADAYAMLADALTLTAERQPRKAAAEFHKQAVKALEQAVKAYTAATLHKLAGDAYGRIANALRHTSDPPPYAQIAEAYKQAAKAYTAAQRYDLAAEAYEEAAEAFAQIAQRELAAKAYWKAARAYLEAAKTDAPARYKEMAAFAYRLAAKYYTPARLDLAARAYWEAAEIFTELRMWLRAAQAYAQVGEHDKAAHAYLRAGLPQEAEGAYAMLAHALMNAGRYTEAVGAFMKAGLNEHAEEAQTLAERERGFVSRG
ncbi:hypothetical protein [Pandoraea oxalativorans]|nr:hypothetical protein [Pandoraea oxalativorans]